MAIIDLHPFGKIDTGNLDDFYEAEIQVSGNVIEVDLNFEDERGGEEFFKMVKMFLEKIPQLQKSAFDYLLESFNKGDDEGTVNLYMNHHLEFLERDEVEEIFGTTDIDITCFLSKLILQRIGFYPDSEDEDSFAVFDITIPGNVTDNVIAVNFDSDGELTWIAMES